MGSRSPHAMGQFWGRKGAGPRQPDTFDGRYTHSDSVGGSTDTVQMPIGFTRWGAHWRHLANTIEPFVCGFHVALYIKLHWPLVWDSVQIGRICLMASYIVCIIAACVNDEISLCLYLYLPLYLYYILYLQRHGLEFNSRPFRCQVTTLGKLFTRMCLCHQAI